MHTRTLLRRSRSVGVAPIGGDRARQLPCALRVYSPIDSHTCQTPWSVFQDGSNGEPAGQCRERAVAEARRRARVVRPRSGRRRSTGISTARALAAASIRAVLFIFPSRYLFAIGISPVFSLGRNLPPDWGCIPKQPDPPTASRGAAGSGHDGALTLSGAPFQGTSARSAAEDASPDYNSDGEAARFSSWTIPGSLAVTRGILPERTTPSTTARELRFQPPLVMTGIAAGLHLGLPPARAHGRPVSAPRTGRWGGDAMRDAQADVPWPNGFGRNLRSKTRWFTDSAIHTKYRISLRSSSMREPRYPLSRVLTFDRRPLRTGAPRTGPPRGGRFVRFSLARSAPGVRFDNDPSAGSPTETLLRLLLPLNDKVQWTFRDVAGSEPPTSPRSEHFTGPFNRFSFQLQSATVSVLLPLFLFLADEITSVCQKICTLPPIVLAEGHQLALSFATAVSVSVSADFLLLFLFRRICCVSLDGLLLKLALHLPDFNFHFPATISAFCSFFRQSKVGLYSNFSQTLWANKAPIADLTTCCLLPKSVQYLQPTLPTRPSTCCLPCLSCAAPTADFLTLLTAAAVGACLQAPMAKGKRSKTQAATTGNSGKVAAAAAATAAAAIAAAILQPLPLLLPILKTTPRLPHSKLSSLTWRLPLPFR
ncbi:UNVERIFIED_CONTAM: hypothetical protein Sangu_3037000 [Sesamum angustifolium]|uniref:Uncharacterized protein n=1 Tax=Sesamum angustifolium TaxID=2727405 RepID=A0AAW2KEH0_9LAMI